MSRLTALRLAVAATLITAFTGARHGRVAEVRRHHGQGGDAVSRQPVARSASQGGRSRSTSEERLRWHFIPNEMFPRKGLMIKDMNETQRRLAHDLLRTGLSARGYMKVTSIIELEDILKAIETGGKMARNKEEYLFSVFGTPAAKGRWGWRVEGHHVSLRFADRRRRRDRQPRELADVPRRQSRRSP